MFLFHFRGCEQAFITNTSPLNFCILFYELKRHRREILRTAAFFNDCFCMFYANSKFRFSVHYACNYKYCSIDDFTNLICSYTNEMFYFLFTLTIGVSQLSFNS